MQRGRVARPAAQLGARVADHVGPSRAERAEDGLVHSGPVHLEPHRVVVVRVGHHRVQIPRAQAGKGLEGSIEPVDICIHRPAPGDRSTASRRSGSESPPSSGHRPFPGVPRCAPRARVYPPPAKSSPTCAAGRTSTKRRRPPACGLDPALGRPRSGRCGDHRRRISGEAGGNPVGRKPRMAASFASLIQ